LFDFRGLRRDGGRLQSYLSYGQNPVLEQQQDLAAHLNTASLHTRKVDNLDEMIIETSNLFCFYSKFFEDNSQMCLEFPAQNRFIIGFPLIGGHFSNTTNDLGPEQCTLSDHILPRHCGLGCSIRNTWTEFG
jgi:hypothetical protein